MFGALIKRQSSGLRTRISLTLLTTGIIGLGLLIPTLSLAQAPDSTSKVLDRFEIETGENNSVRVILYTNERASYHTEPKDKGFSLVLDKTRLSENNLNKGLPVVIDDQNRFIGRAVPMTNGKIKIIIPNLPTDEYSVSVIQKRVPVSTATTDEPKPMPLAPRGAKTMTDTAFKSQFEDVVSQFPRPKPRWTEAKKPEFITPDVAPGVSPAVAHYPTQRPVRQFAPPGVADRAVPPQYYFPQWRPNRSKLVTTPSKTRKTWVPVESLENFNTVAIDEGDDGQAVKVTVAPRPSSNLAYLQIDPGNIVVPEIPESAEETLASSDAEVATAAASPSLFSRFTSLLTYDISGFPLWGVLLAALFFGGIGLFALTAGMLMIRLFINPKLMFQPAPQSAPAPSPHAFDQYRERYTETGHGYENPYEMTSVIPEEEAFIGEPMVFEDRAQVNASEYLIQQPNTVKEAVRNTTLLKFPSNRRRRARLQ